MSAIISFVISDFLPMNLFGMVVNLTYKFKKEKKNRTEKENERERKKARKKANRSGLVLTPLQLTT